MHRGVDQENEIALLFLPILRKMTVKCLTPHLENDKHQLLL